MADQELIAVPAGTKVDDFPTGYGTRDAIIKALVIDRDAWQLTAKTYSRSNDALALENWQLKGALGYPVPGGIPQGDFKCGLCEATQGRLDQIADIAEGSGTVNSLPHIEKIARGR